MVYVRTTCIRKDVLMCPRKGTKCMSARRTVSMCPRKGTKCMSARRTVSAKDEVCRREGQCPQRTCHVHYDNKLSRRFQRSPTTCVCRMKYVSLVRWRVKRFFRERASKGSYHCRLWLWLYALAAGRVIS